MTSNEASHDCDRCDCGRCIRRRVWGVFLRVEEDLRAEIRAEKATHMQWSGADEPEPRKERTE